MRVVMVCRTIQPTDLSCQREAEALPELHRAHFFKRALAPCRVVPDDVAVDALLQLLKGHAIPLAPPEHLRLQKFRRKPSDALVVGSVAFARHRPLDAGFFAARYSLLASSSGCRNLSGS